MSIPEAAVAAGANGGVGAPDATGAAAGAREGAAVPAKGAGTGAGAAGVGAAVATAAASGATSGDGACEATSAPPPPQACNKRMREASAKRRVPGRVLSICMRAVYVPPDERVTEVLTRPAA